MTAPTSTTKVFLDTEFIDTGRVIVPISIALVAATGPEYYAVFADIDLQRIAAHPWLNRHVAPHLPVKQTQSGWAWNRNHPEFTSVKPRTTIASEVTDFFAELHNPETWAYFSPFDTIVLTQLYGPLNDLPAAIPAFTHDLMQEARRHQAAAPSQQPPVHHALHDARHDRAIAAAIGLISGDVTA